MSVLYKSTIIWYGVRERGGRRGKECNKGLGQGTIEEE